jgi:hypothetical protein
MNEEESARHQMFLGEIDEFSRLVLMQTGVKTCTKERLLLIVTPLALSLTPLIAISERLDTFGYRAVVTVEHGSLFTFSVDALKSAWAIQRSYVVQQLRSL